jgi:hypothetical protein
MINKRKLDEVIEKATCDRERDCAYSEDEYYTNPDYQKHVCRYVRHCCMPYCLAKYLYEDCYYDDAETVEANLDYVNSVMRNDPLYETWTDVTIKMVNEEIEELKAKELEAEKLKAEEAMIGENMFIDDDFFDDM